MIPPDLKAMSNVGRINDLMPTRTHRHLLVGKKCVVPEMHDLEYVLHNGGKTSVPLCTVEAVFLDVQIHLSSDRFICFVCHFS